MTNKIPIWLDCDPGHDDALAIILAGRLVRRPTWRWLNKQLMLSATHPHTHFLHAGYNPKSELLGISTVAGNQTVEKVTDNALRVLHAAGMEESVVVVVGQSKPLMRPPAHCPGTWYIECVQYNPSTDKIQYNTEIHGESGLDGPYGGPVLPPSSRSPLPDKAVLYMYDCIKKRYVEGESKTKIQLIATGALTNIALLIILYPDIVDMVDITLMGGVLGIGNTGPVVEFNIQTDPEAAHVVFESGVAVLNMVPLEVTHTALATSQVIERIRVGNSEKELKGIPFRELIVDLLMFFADTYKRVFRFDDPPLHDPCAVAYVLAPEIFTDVEHLRVDIEVASALSAGQTVVDVWGATGKKPNAYVCMKMDVDKFWDLMLDSVEKAAAASPLMGRTKTLTPFDGGGVHSLSSSSLDLHAVTLALNDVDGGGDEDETTTATTTSGRSMAD